MIEILQFIFSGFWIWLGTMVLVAIFGSAFVGVIRAARGRQR